VRHPQEGRGTRAHLVIFYGTLGLNRPDEVQKNVNASYTAGKWVAAAATAGMFVSLLV